MRYRICIIYNTNEMYPVDWQEERGILVENLNLIKTFIFTHFKKARQILIFYYLLINTNCQILIQFSIYNNFLHSVS